MTSELERETERTPKLTATFKYGAASKYEPTMAHNWKVTLHYQGRRLTTDFYGGELIENPSAADVVYSLLIDASAGEETCEDFCSEFGANPDSRQAEADWRASKRNGAKLRHLLGADWDRFASREH